MSDRRLYVEDLLKAVVKMDLRELHLAMCLCQLLVATPEQLEALQRRLQEAP